VPTISAFFGIVISMYWRDHNPAHFHARYGDFEALVRIDTLEVIRGSLPKRALALVLEWASEHRIGNYAALSRHRNPFLPWSEHHDCMVRD
jgi:hypothetical protein